jgi:hypothetical protein
MKKSFHGITLDKKNQEQLADKKRAQDSSSKNVPGTGPQSDDDVLLRQRAIGVAQRLQHQVIHDLSLVRRGSVEREGAVQVGPGAFPSKHHARQRDWWTLYLRATAIEDLADGRPVRRDGEVLRIE